MNLRRQSIVTIACIVCYVAAFAVAHRVVPAGRWDFRLDRETAIAKARETLLRFDVDAANWSAYVEANYSGLSDAYTTFRTPSPDAFAVAPARVKVTLREPANDKRSVVVTLNPQGRALAVNLESSFEIKDEDSSDDDDDGREERRERTVTEESNRKGELKVTAKSGSVNVGVEFNENNSQTNRPTETNQQDVAPATLEAGRRAIARLLNDDLATAYKFVSSTKDKRARGANANDAVISTWEYIPANDADVKINATVKLRGERLTEINLAPRYGGNTDAQTTRHNDSSSLYGGVFALFVVIAAFAFAALLLYGIVRRELAWKLPLQLMLAVALVSLPYYIFGRTLDEALSSPPHAILKPLIVLLNVVGKPLLYGFLFGMMWCMTFTYARRNQRLKIASLIALVRGKITTRFVGQSLFQGLMYGGVILAIQYLFFALGLLKATSQESFNINALVSRAPAFAAFFQRPSFVAFLLFACVLPALYEFVRLPRLPRTLLWLTGTVFLFSSLLLFGGYPTVILLAAMFFIYEWIYRHHDLLTLLTAVFAAHAAHEIATLLIVNNSALQLSGWRAISLFFVFAALAFTVSRRGRVADIEEEIAPDTRNRDLFARAERERLVAEFDVAHQAQQRMLPESAPRIAGYEISAVCRPAREVGGDLYDFIKLPDERIGIVVADVSGKGVPAALYMTLTKGLLASVSENESDPRLILSEVNRHLYEVCRRKTFVTLVLGVLHPATRELTYARAGHNPPVWRRSNVNLETLLQAKGLGLGLNKGKMFDLTLKPQTVTLDKGDAIVFYSDGITEAMNAEREEYGEDRLMMATRRADGLTAAETQSAIMDDVAAFLGDVPPQDDQTVVVLRVTEN